LTRPLEEQMLRKSLTIVVLAATTVLAACGIGPGVTGNDTGGIINWTPEHQRAARDMAAQHCARYGKIARITRSYARYGQYISFECRFPRYR
jgi:hypothetical protein